MINNDLSQYNLISLHCRNLKKALIMAQKIEKKQQQQKKTAIDYLLPLLLVLGFFLSDMI